jgi:DNA-binding transcriptional regulator YhcF (GntR family)
MENPMELIINCETGEQEYVPVSAEKLAEMQAIEAQFVAAEAERVAAAEAATAAKASAVAKLEAVGLTADEIAALTK